MSIATICKCGMSGNGFCNDSVKECTQLIKATQPPSAPSVESRTVTVLINVDSVTIDSIYADRNEGIEACRANRNLSPLTFPVIGAASTTQGAVSVKPVLKWLSEYCNEKGENIALVNGKWCLEDEHDINDEPITEDQLCELYGLQHPDETGSPRQQVEPVKLDSNWMVGRSEDRFKELEHYGWDWRSFYNGWLEGRSDAIQDILLKRGQRQQAGPGWVRATKDLPLHMAFWNIEDGFKKDCRFPVRIDDKVYAMGDIFDNRIEGAPDPIYYFVINGHDYFENDFHRIEWLNNRESASTPSKESDNI